MRPVKNVPVIVHTMVPPLDALRRHALFEQVQRTGEGILAKGTGDDDVIITRQIRYLSGLRRDSSLVG